MLLLSRDYDFQVYPITRDYSGPAERVRLVTCRLTSDYPAKTSKNVCAQIKVDLVKKSAAWREEMWLREHLI